MSSTSEREIKISREASKWADKWGIGTIIAVACAGGCLWLAHESQMANQKQSEQVLDAFVKTANVITKVEDTLTKMEGSIERQSENLKENSSALRENTRMGEVAHQQLLWRDKQSGVKVP